MKEKLRINDQIRLKEVRLITQDGEQLGIIQIQDALSKAKEAGLDLVEVAPDAKPPVCKIVDYSKLLYDQNKKIKDARKKSKSLEVKEIKVRPKIDHHDFEIKVNHAIEFLEKGHKVKITLMFKGREMRFKDIGSKVLDNFVEATSHIATADVEQDPRGGMKTKSVLLSKKG